LKMLVRRFGFEIGRSSWRDENWPGTTRGGVGFAISSRICMKIQARLGATRLLRSSTRIKPVLDQGGTPVGETPRPSISLGLACDQRLKRSARVDEAEAGKFCSCVSSTPFWGSAWREANNGDLSAALESRWAGGMERPWRARTASASSPRQARSRRSARPVVRDVSASMRPITANAVSRRMRDPVYPS